MRITFIFLILAISGLATAQNLAPDTLKYCLDEDFVALGGHDPVAYFKDRRALEGNHTINATHDGASYYFANHDHKRAFLKDPKKYLPEFGGWCSMTLAMGRATTPVYDNFLIVQGKLFLFERTMSVNGRELWQKDPEQNNKRAQYHYQQYKETGTILP